MKIVSPLFDNKLLLSVMNCWTENTKPWHGISIQTDVCFCSELLLSLDAQIESMMYKADREWHCSVCGKSGVGKTDISRHIEGTHITNHPGLQCHICGEKLKSRNALRLHKSSKHKSFFVM